MDIQFSNHAIERVTGRFSRLAEYIEVYVAVSQKAKANQLRPGNNEVLVKILRGPVKVKDPTCVDGSVKGDRIVALCTVKNGGCYIDTVVLR